MSWLLSPLSWLLVAALLSPLAWLARSRWLTAACIVLAGVAFAASTPLVANRLLAQLERPVAAADLQHCNRVPPDTVIVLAGGVDRVPSSRTDFSVMNIQSRRRTERGVQYWREHGGSRIIFTGGATRAPSVAHADLMGEYARRLGLPERALILERRSRNTQENARNVAVLMPLLPHRIALVTSAMHMPRAQMAFEAAGFKVCPQSTDFRAVSVDPPGYLRPVSSSLVKTESALHELVGIAYYRWRTWRAVSTRDGRVRRREHEFSSFASMGAVAPSVELPRCPRLLVSHGRHGPAIEPRDENVKSTATRIAPRNLRSRRRRQHVDAQP